MTDRSKFEEMLERLVNEDRAAAEELFHEIVVEKSREIYQAIIESEEEDDLDESEDDDIDESEEDDLDESEDDDIDESEEDELEESADADDDLDESEDDDIDEMFGLDEFELEADPMAAMGGDETDDMMGDLGMGGDDDMGDMGDEEGDEGGADSAFSDLEDALDALKAEFEAMMGGEEGEEGEEGDMDDMGGEEPEEEPEEESYAFEAKHKKEVAKKDDKKEKKSSAEEMREYVEKVAPSKMGDNGTNNKSIVAAKNDMGGTTANILRTDTENSGEANKGQLKGNGVFKGTAKQDNAGNINVPGGKAGKTSFKKTEPGHGAEKKGKPETADKGAASLIKTTVRNR